MTKLKTTDASSIECLFSGVTCWGQDGNLYSGEEGTDGVLSYVTEEGEDEIGEMQYSYIINNKEMLNFPEIDGKDID